MRTTSDVVGGQYYRIAETAENGMSHDKKKDRYNAALNRENRRNACAGMNFLASFYQTCAGRNILDVFELTTNVC